MLLIEWCCAGGLSFRGVAKRTLRYHVNLVLELTRYGVDDQVVVEVEYEENEYEGVLQEGGDLRAKDSQCQKG